jgi:hypothetical protein
MKWPWQKKKGGGKGSFEAGSSQVSARRGRGERAPGGLAIVGTLVGILVGVYTLAPVVEGILADEKPVEVELAEITVSNPRLQYGGDGPTPESEPAVTATVRNHGEGTAWIDEARITVLDGARVSTCFTQGGGPDVPHSKPYRVTMPEFPNGEKRVIRRPLHVAVQPGHGARPLLKFQKRSISTTDLYAIDVTYVVDPGEEILDAGRFVIGVPGPPDRGGFVLPEDEIALTSEEFRQGTAGVLPTTSWCLRHNLASVRRLTADPGLRSAEIAALSHVRPAPAWSEVIDHEPPREAVETLLASESLDAPIYAVEAAAETGDKAYEDEVRRRAVATLLKLGKEDLSESGSVSVSVAERALSLERTDAGSQLLTEAKVAATTQEERLQAELEAEEATAATGE